MDRLPYVGSLLNTSDNGFSYSINQSAKETPYVPTSRDEKHKAKAFIDVFVQRAAKAVAVVLSLGISLWLSDFESVRWLALANVAIVTVWLFAARYAGRAFRVRAEGERVAAGRTEVEDKLSPRPSDSGGQ